MGIFPEVRGGHYKGISAVKATVSKDHIIIFNVFSTSFLNRIWHLVGLNFELYEVELEGFNMGA